MPSCYASNENQKGVAQVLGWPKSRAKTLYGLYTALVHLGLTDGKEGKMVFLRTGPGGGTLKTRYLY